MEITVSDFCGGLSKAEGEEM